MARSETVVSIPKLPAALQGLKARPAGFVRDRSGELSKGMEEALEACRLCDAMGEGDPVLVERIARALKAEAFRADRRLRQGVLRI